MSDINDRWSSPPLARGGPGQQLMTPGEVARMFGVDPKTVARWADAGKIAAIRTLGGHRRYRPSDVEALLDGEAAGAPDPRIVEDAGEEPGEGLRPAAAG